MISLNSYRRQLTYRLRTRLRAAVLPATGIVAATALIAVTLGTPHVGGEYACAYRPYASPTCKIYDWCAYYGLNGRRVLFGDECGGLIKMLPLD